MRGPVPNRAGYHLVHGYLPRMSHARDAALIPVPGSGDWRLIGTMGTSHGSGGEPAPGPGKFDRPMVAMGAMRFAPGPEGNWMRSWTASEDPCLARQLYTREEVAAMSALGDFVLHAAFEGPAWQAGDSTCSCALEMLEKRCGIPGRSSWSCGIVAENLLCAAMGGAADTSSRVSFEAAWLAAADRLTMIRSCRDCEKAGAIVTSAFCGRLTLFMPRSPEGFWRVAKAAWKAGLIIPAAYWPASVGPMAMTGDFPERFGGREEDLQAALWQVRGDYRDMYNLDFEAAHHRRAKGARPA